jgi:hypothetical protein
MSQIPNAAALTMGTRKLAIVVLIILNGFLLDHFALNLKQTNIACVEILRLLL